MHNTYKIIYLYYKQYIYIYIILSAKYNSCKSEEIKRRRSLICPSVPVAIVVFYTPFLNDDIYVMKKTFTN